MSEPALAEEIGSRAVREPRAALVTSPQRCLLGAWSTAFAGLRLLPWSGTARTRGEPEVKPYRLLNDLRRETIPAVADLVHPRAATTENAASPERRDNAPTIIPWGRVRTAMYDRRSPYYANGHPVLPKI